MKEIPVECNDISHFDPYIDRHPDRLLARQMQEPFIFRGREYPAGDYLVVVSFTISPDESKCTIERAAKEWFEQHYKRQNESD